MSDKSDCKPSVKFLQSISNRAHGKLAKIANESGLTVQEVCRLIIYEKLGLLPQGEPKIKGADN